MMTVDGLKLEVLESLPIGQTVFLLHGNSSSAEAFLPLMDGPLGRQYRLIAISLPGHGRSDPALSPAEQYSIPALARLMLHAIARFNVDEYTLVGHGLGGHVLTHALPRLPDASGLVLISAPPISAATLNHALRPDPVGGALNRGALRPEEIDHLAKAILGPAQADGTLLDRQWTSIATTDRAFRPALGESVTAGGVADEQAILMHSPVPVALVWGSEDAFIEPSCHDNVLAGKWLKDGRYKFWGSGHSPHLEVANHFPTLLNSLLLEAFEFSFTRAI
jgi:pimeloyl-ACP methyl ester carboxylesterase